MRATVIALALLFAAGCADARDADAGPPEVGARLDRDAPLGAADASADALIERCFVPFASTREAYAERLRGLWLAENVANWTGLLTESERRATPFFTDADWGTPQGRAGVEGSAAGTITWNVLDPWGADDDTDIEMVYLEAMRRAGTAHLSPTQIRDAWREHIAPDIYVWVSNAAVRHLFDAPVPVLPPSTSLLAANDQALMIDAQLTTELFGALAPGRPVHALELANLPILATATGFAAHAAQVHVVMYSLAPVLAPSLSPHEATLCLVHAARRLVPDTSKTADVIDLVLEERERHEQDEWELARDRVAAVFQEDAARGGYRYLEWYESSVNLATGLIALLFGEGDLARTIQIGTLSGWDSDNGTATMGGLLGLVHGEAWVRESMREHVPVALSDRYRIARTRYGFPREEYSLAEIAELAMPRVEESVRESGGEISDARLFGDRVTDRELDARANPYVRAFDVSATAHAERDGERVESRVIEGILEGPIAIDAIADGLELDASGRDRALEVRDEARVRIEPLSARHVSLRGERVSVEVTWDRPRTLEGARFVEGPVGPDGGWLASPRIEVWTGAGWVAPALSAPLETGSITSFGIRDARFVAPIEARGVRLSGTPGGTSAAVTLLELDGLVAE